MAIAPTQPQLLPMALDPSDVVYTPDWVARDMVEYFKPSGRILEPCCGDGVFMRYLPADTLWCEIEKGRDFFAWRESVDWIIGNPPYKIFGKWLRHSLELSNNICYLIPIAKVFSVVERIKEIYKWGGIVETVYYGKGTEMGFPFGFPCGAVHLRKNYTGATMITMYHGAE